jgi:outer membrane murein-binding lipoprotein Lpp
MRPLKQVTKYAFLTVMALFLLAAAAPAQSQDGQTTSQQELRDRLQRLEQEVEALREQINAAPAAPQKPGAISQPEAQGPVPATTKPVPIPPQSPEKPEQQPVDIPWAGGDGPSEESETPVPERSIDIYGHVMLDSGYNFKSIDPNWFDVMRPTKLPAFTGEFGPNGSVYFSVRQTRFGVKSTLPTPYGDLKTLFEFELFGVGAQAGQTTFRLRHAYGQLWHIGAGQTWSPFMDPDVFPNILEYWGPSGMVFFRNLQFRVMPVMRDRLTITLAAENPGATADQGIYSNFLELQTITPRFVLPDFSWQVRTKGKWGHVQVAGIFRRIAWDVATPNPVVRSDTVLGWGINTSSVLNLSKTNVLRLQVVYGKGIENYMNDAPIDVGVQRHLSTVRGVPLPVWGEVSFLEHEWSKRLSTAVGYSLVNIDNSNGQLPSDFHQGHYAIGNLLFHPVTQVTIGGEFQFGRRVNFRDGFNVNDDKLQVSFKYDFKKMLEY